MLFSRHKTSGGDKDEKRSDSYKSRILIVFTDGISIVLKRTMSLKQSQWKPVLSMNAGRDVVLTRTNYKLSLIPTPVPVKMNKIKFM